MGKSWTVLILAAAVLAACSDVPTEPPERLYVPQNDHLRWSDAQRTAYEQCLQDNMAVAMAWEAIEQRCKDQVAGTDTESPVPSTDLNP